MSINNPTTNPLPTGYGTTVGLTSGPALPANASRGGLIFHNPSNSVTVAICPAVVNLATLGVYGGNAAGVAVINGAGSVTLQPGDKFIIDNIQCTGAFNAIAGAAGGLLTVWEH
jgi:hypothetical protein